MLRKGNNNMITLDEAKKKIMNHKLARNAIIFDIFENDKEWIFVLNNIDKNGYEMWMQPAVLMIDKLTNEINELSFAKDESFILSHKEIYRRKITLLEAELIVKDYYKNYKIMAKYESNDSFLFVINNEFFKLTKTLIIDKYYSRTTEYFDISGEYITKEYRKID